MKITDRITQDEFAFNIFYQHLAATSVENE